MVEDYGEDKEVVVGGPRPWTPMGKIAIYEEESAKQTLEVELVPMSIPLLG